MSAMHHGDISLIRDEDLLKKMWQETEDFGKKKEIRSHMYKLREARLKDLYNSSEVKGVTITTNTKLPFIQSTHADSLVDHSFASLKSKEIRDSESPTRDVSYRITGPTNNDGWNISKIDERSEDGKTRRILQSAQTSGSEIIPKGKLDFEAKCDQAVTSFQDGDDKNFVRSQGLSSKTVVRQEAVGGDENSSFKSSSTKSSSSSKTVTEQKMSYDDSSDYIPHQQKSSNTDNYIQRSVKVYESDAPQELKSHPGYVEGHTKITRETKTLADGTVVTTTKYETTGANETRSTSSNQYSSSNSNFQQSKSNYSSSTSQKDKCSTHKTIVDSEKLPKEQPQPRSRYYVEKTHTIPDNSSDSYQNTSSERKTIVNHQTYKKDDQSISDQFSDDKYGIVITSDSRNDHSKRSQTDDFENTTRRQEQYREKNTTTNRKTDISNRIDDVRNERTTNINKQHNTTVYQDVNSVPLGTPIEIEIDVSKIDINDNTKPIVETSSRQHIQLESKSPDRIDRNSEQKRQPIKPTESEWKTETKATKNQYDTTYRTDYTNKRISVELSPTHDAFARSLRAVSPDRLSSRSSSRNLKTSNTSLRSSSSPEKTYVNHDQPSRSSPERQRCYSPTKKTPDRLSSTETITYSSRPSVERTSPYTSQKTKHITESRKTTSHADVFNKKTKSSNDTNNTSITSKSTRMSPTKSPSRSSTPSKSERHRTTVDVTTDLDDNISTISSTTISKTERVRPFSLKYEVTETVGVTRNTQLSPTSHIPNKEKPQKNYEKKDKPIDRPLKRTDTYEERCRQILGITNETTERRRSSLEKLKRRGSSTSTTTEILSKDTTGQQEMIRSKRISPTRHIPQSNEKTENYVTPKKQKSPLQEFPAQIRRSPEKSPRQPSPTKNSNEKSPEPCCNRESPPYSRTSTNGSPGAKDRRSPSTEVNKNLKRKSSDKEVRRDIQRSSSDTKKLTENYGDDNRQTETYNHKKNESVLEKTQHRDITVSVDEEFIRRDYYEEPNSSDQTAILEISKLKTPQEKPRNDVSEVHNLTSEEMRNKKFISEKTLSTEADDKYVIDNSVHTSQTLTFNKKSPKDDQPSVTDDVNITFIKEEAENQLKNVKNLFDSSNRKVHETQDTTNYNESTEKTINPICTTSKTSPIRKTSPLNKQSKESTRNHEINTTFIEQEVINRKLSEDQIDISKRKDSKTREHKVESNATTRKQTEDDKYDKKTEIVTPTSKPTTRKTPSSRETSPLKEYPSQVRKPSDIDDANRKFIKKESVNPQVTPEIPEVHKSFKPKTSLTDKRPNTSQNLRENEDVSFDSSRSETSEKIALDEKVITTTKQYAGPVDVYPNTLVEQKYTINNLNQYSDTISIKDSSEQISDENKVNSSRKTIKLEDNFKPNISPNVDSKNKPSSQHNIPKDRKSVPSQQDNLDEINKRHLENSSINSEKTPQHKQISTSRKPSYPTDTEISTQFSEDISQDASVLVDDIIYTNGDIREKNNIIENTVNLNEYTVNVIQNNAHDLQIDSQDEVEIAITSKRVSTNKNRTDNIQKQKGIHKEQDVPTNKDAKRNTVQSKQASLNRTTEDKNASVKKTVSSKDIPKPKDKPTQKVTNYASKKSTSSQNMKTEISKQIHNENLKINAKKIQQPNVKLNGDREVKEVHKKEYFRETYEGRTPVEEPLVIKKSVSLLYSDEEDDIKSTQMLIESEIIDQKPIVEKKKDKTEKLSKTTSSKFIVNEKKETISKSKQPISNSSPKSIPVFEKKPLSDKNFSKPKMSGETEYTDKYKKKLVQTKYENNKRQNTISDIETFDDLKTDTSPHVRVHRIDDRTNKTKNSTLKSENNDGPIKISKKITPLKKPSNDSPKSKTYSGNKIVTEKTSQSTKPKSVEPIQHLVKETKPSTKVKHIVSTTILLKPKTTTSKVVTVSSKKNKDSTKRISSSSSKKEVIECEESDDESIPDSLDDSMQHSVTNIAIIENQMQNEINTKSTIKRSSPERKSPPRNYSQPDSKEEKPKATKPKLEKRCISTKSIIINNADRGVTVDLQRSISSREPTPDRVCPLPVTSDDEGTSPRFPDKVVEPDDNTLKRNSHRLFETVIQENDDGREFQRIVEITEDSKQKVTEVDKVDRDDDSLLTVNKKINKFLTTADKLTEKPIMDISQPAPKVERQKFEITEDLREDDCLLSVSDKVNKFINEAEYLTSHNNSQPRKSVNIENKSDITKKVTLTTELKVNQEPPSKPSDKKYVPKNNTPLRNENNKIFDQNVSTIHQDVFITTECDQIEKEQDSYRSSKHSPKVINSKKEPENVTPSDTNETRISNFKPYSRGSKSPDKVITDTFSSERVQSTETTRKTEKNIDRFTENEQLVETPQNKRKPEESPKTFTPKNRRPSQEEKVILSTVGRLRSSESIKKAKALFENKSSSKEIKKHTDVIINKNDRSVVEERKGSTKEITRRPIDRSSLTPKRLDFPASDDISTNRNSSVKHSVSNQHKVNDTKVYKSILNTDEERDKNKHTTLRKQQSPQREIIKTATRGREPERSGSKERDMPGYMKPLERNIRPHSPVYQSSNETETIRTHEDEKCIIREEIPGYMKPLDRSTHKSPERDEQHPYITNDKSTYEESRGGVPGYMKPLSTNRHKEPDHSSRSDRKENILSNRTSQAHESISTIHQKKNHSNTSAIHQTQSHVDSISTEELPGYMKPLKQHIHREEYSQMTETHRRNDSRGPDTTDELPGYMKPLIKHNHKVEDLHVSKTHDSDKRKGSIHSDEIPGYMRPIHSHSHKHEHTDLTETEEMSDRIIPGSNKPRASIHADDVPGYMKPLHSHSHQHEHTDFTETEELSDRIIHGTNQPRASIHSDDIPGYMKPIHSHSHTHEHAHFTKAEDRSDRIVHGSNKPRESINSDDIPGYMKPIHSHSHRHEHTDFTETEGISDRIIHDTDKPRQSIHSDDIPGYMKPIHSHSHRHQHTDFTETEGISDRIIHDTDKPRHSIHSDDIPGYMKPIHSQSHTREHTHFTTAEDRSDRIIHGSIKPRESINSEDIPGYMKPIHSHSHRHEHTDFTETEGISDRIIHDTDKPRQSIHSDDIPGYMKPIHSHRHSHEQTDSSHRDEICDSKTNKERNLRGHSPHKDNSPSHDMKRLMEPSDVDEVPGYMKPLDRTNRPNCPKIDNPSGYMKPLDKTNSPHSTKKDSQSSKKPSEPHGTSTKFGITLKKTDSMKGITNTTVTPKKHPILSKKNITEEEIEEIFELELLEELLLIVTGYELRRQIRTQIRCVKKLIAENKLEVTIRNIRNKNSGVDQSKEITITEVRNTENDDKLTKNTNRLKTTIDNKYVDQSNIEEMKKNVESFKNTSTYSRKESTSSFVRSETPDSRSSKSPERRSPERKSPSRLRREEPSVKKSVEINPQSTQKTTSVKLPEEKTTKTTNIFKPNLKKTENITKGPVNNVQPEWTSQRNLKKVTTNENVKKVVNKSTKKEPIRSSSPSKEVKSTDVITSSYGVGPTDENGTPLFGLKALRAQNKSINTKVQGTVVSSQYYTETGKEPIGQISVTKYSSDPKDLGSNENLTYQDEGILSITTTQKFGFDDAPSLKQLTSTERDIRDSQTNRKASTSKSSTVTRRNSVKALTQKFVENAVETSKSEQQSSYPKAGLILRSSSFKNDSTQDASDRYSEVTAEERSQTSMSVISSNSRVVSGGTFLRNKSKVTGIQDVVTRMKAEDVEAGDTSEDIEARGLLNKYLGSQAILSGIEGQVSKTTTSTARTSSSSAAVKNTTKVTTVIMENGKEVKKTRIFEHPLSDEVLETVWDEQTLRYLLEQSTDYEERKSIRARLRVIMAEQEACTELVKQASQDQSGQSVDETTETNREVVTEGPVRTTKVTTSRVITQQTTSKKPISPFAKFRQLDKQNSLNTPPSTPRTPGGSPIFKFTDAALSQSASTIKDRLLYWCRMKTKEYENIQLDNFSTSWADGLAFCALIHHFLPNSFDYHALTPKERRHNFTLAFKVADEKADIAPLLDVDDMVATRKPDWKCVFTYVQSIYRRFKDED